MADEAIAGEESHETAEQRTERQRRAIVATEGGSLERALDNLINQTADLRRANRELKDKLPKDGTVVLSPDDAKVWSELQKVGLPAGEIAKKLTEGTAAQLKLSVMERDKVADEAAKLLGYNAPILRGMARIENLTLAIQDVADPSGGVDGEGKKKKIRVAVVIPEGDDADPVPLDEYVSEHLGDFQEALAGSETERNSNREPPAPRVIRQKSGENGRVGVTAAQLDEAVRSRLPFTSV